MKTVADKKGRVSAPGNTETLCWTCIRNANDCSWMDNLEPVEGWQAEEREVSVCDCEYGVKGTHYEKTYFVRSCPLYIRRKTEKKKAKPDMSSKRFERLCSVADKILDKVESTVEGFDAGTVVTDRQALKQMTSALKDIKDIQSLQTGAEAEEQRIKLIMLSNQLKDNSAQKNVCVRFEGSAGTYGD